MSQPITGVTAGGALWTPAFVQSIAQERCIGCGRCFKVCPRDVFDLVPKNKGAGDPNHYLSDGHVTLVIMPWDITAYEGTGIITQGMDHIGFKVESLEAFKADVARIAASNPRLSPAPMTGPEGQKLEALFRRSCPLGQHQMADCDGTLIDVTAE